MVKCQSCGKTSNILKILDEGDKIDTVCTDCIAEVTYMKTGSYKLSKFITQYCTLIIAQDAESALGRCLGKKICSECRIYCKHIHNLSGCQSCDKRFICWTEK